MVITNKNDEAVPCGYSCRLSLVAGQAPLLTAQDCILDQIFIN
jgi:hypothetical protein